MVDEAGDRGGADRSRASGAEWEARADASYVKQETAMPAAANRRAQQRAMDKFREEYNQVRPHEALAMETPAAVYDASPRRFPMQIPEPEYPDTMLVRSVSHKGEFSWKKHHVFVSEVLWGERIGLLPVDEHCYTVYFARFPL